jgi:hypothetical protein
MTNKTPFGYTKDEHQKCIDDKSRVYMIEKFLTTYDFTVKDFVPIKPFDEQKHILEIYSKSNKTIISKYRQSGITTISCAYVACESILNNNYDCAVITCNTEHGLNLINKIKTFIEQIPNCFYREKQNIFQIKTHKKLKLSNGSNIYTVKTLNDLIAKSPNLIIFDEMSYIENNKKLYDYLEIIPNVKCIIYSTPNKNDVVFKHIFESDENGYTKVKINWFNDPRYNKELKWVNENGYIIDTEKFKFSANDLLLMGYKPTSPWYVNMCNKLGNDIEKINMEIWNEL